MARRSAQTIWSLGERAPPLEPRPDKRARRPYPRRDDRAVQSNVMNGPGVVHEFVRWRGSGPHESAPVPFPTFLAGIGSADLARPLALVDEPREQIRVVRRADDDHELPWRLTVLEMIEQDLDQRPGGFLGLQRSHPDPERG